VVLVAATPDPPGPHELRPPRLDGLGRIGEQLASAEAAVLSDGDIKIGDAVVLDSVPMAAAR